MTFSINPSRRDLVMVGYTTRRHLLLDLDDTPRVKAEGLARLIQDSWPDVGDCLLVQSSRAHLRLFWNYNVDHRPFLHVERDGHHLVFDGMIGYNRCCHIVETLAALNVLQKSYLKIRNFRGDMTLRTSKKVLITGEKPAPVPVYVIESKKRCVRPGGMRLYIDFLRCCTGLNFLKGDVCIIPAQPRDRNYTP